MAKQIERREMLRAHGQLLGRLNDELGHEAPRVLGKFLLGDHGHQAKQVLLTYEIGQDTARNFQQREGPF